MNIILEKELEKQDEIFYRYSIDKIKFWFSQAKNNGNIYVVYVDIEDNKYSSDFEIHIYNDDRNDVYYPVQFRMEIRKQDILTSVIDEYIDKVKYISSVVDAIQNFFETSKHRRAYKGKFSI